ncbi:hypothetical protein BASA81_008095 [Batrachochytrium salamandrivorans]|nr:hypothetical protein BASA81_008095 [Batrachochytrium salamandrivorans]
MEYQHLYATGNHRIFHLCGRRWITGPHGDYPVQLYCLAAFFLCLVAWLTLSILYVGRCNVMLSLTPFVSFVCALWCFLLAACTDPGISPKLPASLPQQPPSGGRWCEFCHREKVLGMFHCTSCDVCVHELDHHCGVIGNCVGARNKFVFLGVIGFAQLFFSFGLINLGLSLGYLYAELDDFSTRAFDIANWTIASLELAIWLILVLDVGLNHWGFGQPNSLVERWHNRMWLLLDHPHGKLFVNYSPRTPCVGGGGIASKLDTEGNNNNGEEEVMQLV